MTKSESGHADPKQTTQTSSDSGHETPPLKTAAPEAREMLKDTVLLVRERLMTHPPREAEGPRQVGTRGRQSPWAEIDQGGNTRSTGRRTGRKRSSFQRLQVGVRRSDTADARNHLDGQVCIAVTPGRHLGAVARRVGKMSTDFLAPDPVQMRRWSRGLQTVSRTQCLRIALAATSRAQWARATRSFVAAPITRAPAAAEEKTTQN